MTERLLADITVPVRIVSEANVRGHWSTKAKRVKLHRNTAYAMARSVINPSAIDVSAKLRVLMTRYALQRMDNDNLAGGFKAVRDGIADAFGIDDGSDRWNWQYGQESAKRGVYAARVQIWEVMG
jgi:hypothetical protein